MFRFLQSKKRPCPTSTSGQSGNHYDGQATVQEASVAAKADSQDLPAKKRRRGVVPRGKVLYILRNLLKDHEWTPSPSSRFQAEPPKRTGPGAPGVLWTRDRTIALIRLVVKTDLPFDHIPVALEEPDWAPGEQACRNQWMRIFHSPPEQARLLSKDAQEKRCKELKTAYDHFMKHQQALERGSRISDLPNATSSIRKLTTSLAEATQQRPQPANPTPPYSPDDQPRVDTELVTVNVETPQLTPAEASHSGQENESRRPRKPTNRAECATLAGLEPQVLDWIIYGNRRGAVERVRDSWRSRNSGRYSTDSSNTQRRRLTVETDVPPLPANFGATSTISPPLCRQLRETYYHGCEPWTWSQVAAQMEHSIATRAVDVTESDEQGITPLHLATAMGCLPVVCVLLAAKADPEARTKTGLSVSAFSRTFARDRTLSLEHIVHIEAAREVVKHNAELKNIERRVRVKGGMVDAGSQTMAWGNVQMLSPGLQPILENDLQSSQPVPKGLDTTVQSSSTSLAELSQKPQTYLSSGTTNAHKDHIKGSVHDTRKGVHGQNFGIATHFQSFLSKRTTDDDFPHYFDGNEVNEMHSGDLSPVDYSMMTSISRNVIQRESDTAQLEQHATQGFGLPMMESPNQSCSTLVPRESSYQRPEVAYPQILSTQNRQSQGTNRHAYRPNISSPLTSQLPLSVNDGSRLLGHEHEPSPGDSDVLYQGLPNNETYPTHFSSGSQSGLYSETAQYLNAPAYYPNRIEQYSPVSTSVHPWEGIDQSTYPFNDARIAGAGGAAQVLHYPNVALSVQQSSLSGLPSGQNYQLIGALPPHTLRSTQSAPQLVSTVYPSLAGGYLQPQNNFDFGFNVDSDLYNNCPEDESASNALPGNASYASNQ